MHCPKCNIELEIFTRSGKEIYVCPFCLSGLIPDESSIKILKYFCKEEIINRLILSLLDGSIFDVKKMLFAEENLACPRCKSYMKHYDFNRKIRFYVNKCINCGSIWLNQMQIPLVSVAFIENNPDDLNFKKSITDIYEIIVKQKRQKIRPFDEIIAPFVVMSGLVPVIPTNDNILKKTKPLVTRTLIITCITVFMLQIIFNFQKVITFFALYAEKINQGEWYRLVTCEFLHADIFHLLVNMFFLYIFGKTVEDELGWKKYLFLFFLGAIVSGIFVFVTIPRKDIPCIGASGAISAIIGTYLILFPKAKIRFSIRHPFTFHKITDTEVSSLYYILSWIIINIIFGALQSAGIRSGIAYWGHIGGFVSGIIFAEVYKNLKQG